MEALRILKKYAKARENALRISKSITSAKAKAISKILKEADLYAQKSERLQLNAVIRLENEILLLLPNPESRFSKLRACILDLVKSAKQKNYVSDKYSIDNERSSAT
jgi:hypothetical protein